MPRSRRSRKKPKPLPRIALLLADPKGNIFEHPDLDLVIDDGVAPRPAEPSDLCPLPQDWEIMQLPGVLPLGIDRGSGQIVVVDRVDLGQGSFRPCAVAVHSPPGYVRTHLPGADYNSVDGDSVDGEQRAGLPLWAYTAAGSAEGVLVAAAFQVDELSRWAPSLYDRDDLGACIEARRAELPNNRALQQLALCATEYGCRCAQNIFYQRWEGALPMASACNAACLGCLSRKPEWDAPVPQYRMSFVPSPEELSQVMVHHLRHAPEPMVSFGQGCEGEPTVHDEVLIEAVSRTREQCDQGIINLNTNGSRPRVVQHAVEAGVGAVRVSINSLDPAAFDAYYRPTGFGVEQAVDSLRRAHQAGAFTSINLLLWPGWTDRREELEALSALVESGCLDMVQLRNLCVDPAHYSHLLPDVDQQRLGIRGLVLELASRHPQLRFGTFNPRLAAPWYQDLAPLPLNPLMTGPQGPWYS